MGAVRCTNQRQSESKQTTLGDLLYANAKTVVSEKEWVGDGTRAGCRCFGSRQAGAADLIICGYRNAHEDGYVLIRKLRSLERDSSRKHLPAVALTLQPS